MFEQSTTSNFNAESSKLVVNMTLGPHVKHSYDDMFRKFAKLAKISSNVAPLLPKQAKIPETIIKTHSPTTLTELSWIRDDQVAMDFSGKNGKLVTNSKEIKNLKSSRPHLRLSRRISGNHVIHPTSSIDLDAELCDASWFHGLLSRDEASTLMKADGLKNGLFMVRKSCTVDHVYMLTFCMNDKIYHCQLLQDSYTENETWCSLANGPAFPSVDNLIEHYRQKPMNGLSVALRRPCQRRRKSLTLPATLEAESWC